MCLSAVSVVQTWRTDVSVRCRVVVVRPPLVSAVQTLHRSHTFFFLRQSASSALFLTAAAQSDASV